MGIKLGDLVVKRELAEGELSGKIVAFDTYNMLYQFISSIRTPEGHPLSTDDGTVISHLKGLFSRTTNLVSDGIEPVFVFDGVPHELKRGTLDMRRERKEKAQKEWESALERGDMETARTKAMQTSHLTGEMVEHAKKLLDLMGMPHMTAPADGEAQASYMCQKGDVYAISSQDFDSVLFGCPIIVRNLGASGRRKLPGSRSWVSVSPEVISTEGSLESMGVTRKQLVDMAIMIGTDFNDGVKGIGPKKALKLIREFGDLETITKEKRIPFLEFDEVRRIFLQPNVSDDYEICNGNIDEDGIKEFLVEELSFGVNGVDRNLQILSNKRQTLSQPTLDSFF